MAITFHIIFLLLVFVISTSLQNVKSQSSSYEDNMEVRIVGGEIAKERQFPYQVGLVFLTSDPYVFCGGVLLSKAKVATTASCCEQTKTSRNEFIVIAGITNMLKGSSETRVSKTKSIVMHPGFNKNNMDNDICMITLEKPFEFNTAIKPISLCNKRPLDGAECVVSGWGTSSFGESSSYDLRFANVNIWSQRNCTDKKVLGSAVTKNMICASAPGKGTCQRDTGGPLSCGKCLAGIVSWGQLCELNLPDVYVNINSELIRNFLKENM